MDETISLWVTVNHLEMSVGKYIHEYLILTSQRTTKESLEICDLLVRKFPEKIKIHQQVKPFLGGALQEGIELASGEYILLMASDLETDPRAVKYMITEMENSDADIVVATRWKKGGFRKYNPLKYVLNFFFQRIFRALYAVPLTDLSYAFRLYKAPLLKMFTWDELKHPFLLECIVKPLRFDIKVVEVPTVWRARIEGRSNNNFILNFEYIRVGLRNRYREPREFIKENVRMNSKKMIVNE